MNKASRNVASVNGNQVDLQEVVTSLQADLQLAKEVAQGNYDIAEQLGGALEIAEAKISTLQARVEELEMHLLANNEIKEAVKKQKVKKTANEEVSVEV